MLLKRIENRKKKEAERIRKLEEAELKKKMKASDAKKEAERLHQVCAVHLYNVYLESVCAYLENIFEATLLTLPLRNVLRG